MGLLHSLLLWGNCRCLRKRKFKVFIFLQEASSGLERCVAASDLCAEESAWALIALLESNYLLQILHLNIYTGHGNLAREKDPHKTFCIQKSCCLDSWTAELSPLYTCQMCLTNILMSFESIQFSGKILCFTSEARTIWETRRKHFHFYKNILIWEWEKCWRFLKLRRNI